MHCIGETAGEDPDRFPKYVMLLCCAVYTTRLSCIRLKRTLDRRFDSDFRTLQHLINDKALGEVLEAEIHYDFPNAGWIHGWTEKDYTPGKGMLFGLGKRQDFRVCLINGSNGMRLFMTSWDNKLCREPHYRPSPQSLRQASVSDWVSPGQPWCG